MQVPCVAAVKQAESDRLTRRASFQHRVGGFGVERRGAGGRQFQQAQVGTARTDQLQADRQPVGQIAHRQADRRAAGQAGETGEIGRRIRRGTIQRERALASLLGDGLVEQLSEDRFALPGQDRNDSTASR